MTNLEDIAEGLREILRSLEDEIETAAYARRLAMTVATPIPKPHEVTSIKVPLHLTSYETGMWEASSPLIPALRVESADKAKLVEQLVPEELERLIARR